MIKELTELNKNLNVDAVFRVLLIGSISPIPSILKQTTPKNLPALNKSSVLKWWLNPLSAIFHKLNTKIVTTVERMVTAAIIDVVTKNFRCLISEKGIDIAKAIIWIVNLWPHRLETPKLQSEKSKNWTANMILATPPEKMSRKFTYFTKLPQFLPIVFIDNSSMLK